MGLFRYQRQDNGQIKVAAEDIDALHETCCSASTISARRGSR